MKRKWKRVSVLCLSAMLGCMLPMSTMRAAEGVEYVENVQENESDFLSGDIVDPAEDLNGSKLTENPADDIDDADLEGNAGVKKEAAESEIYAQSEEGSAPVVEIQLEGVNRAQELEGQIAYNVYIGNHGQRLHIYVNQDSKPTALWYYLDVITDGSDTSKSEGELAALWQAAEQTIHQEISLEKDGKYVLYVKAAAANEQVSYARTDGIVVDTIAPVITGINNGGTYPAGTKFRVEDDNLDTVMVNEQQAVPSSDDGMYQIAASAGSASCVIRAKDKVGNETVYSITVDEIETDTTVIIENGTYFLRAGIAYRLDYGNWTLEGDNTVYRGGSMFYVNEDGSYNFKRSQ